MALTSFSFFTFFLIVFIGCLIFENNNRQKKLLLLVVSYYFYMTIDWRFPLLLLALTFINYYIGSYILKEKRIAVKRWLVIIAVTLSLSILFYFKYANFFIESITELLNFGFIDRENPIIKVVLPVGISFMTFQAITYPIDIYTGKLTKRATIIDFSLFMAFFPQLLSGPIVRASYFLPQLNNNEGFNGKNIFEGIGLILRGIIKKVIFADILAMHIVDPAFNNPSSFSSAFLLVAIIAFSFQVYMDLSGYTDIALGTGKILGYKLPINFNRPYLATSIANYWQRWHISMSSFFRDYLYEAIAPLKFGNIYSKLIIVFIAIGLWHGAGWNFILYGLIHGMLVGFEHYKKNIRLRVGESLIVYRGFKLFLRIIQVFLIISFTRILFRGSSLEESINYFTELFTSEGTGFPLSWIAGIVLALAVLLHIVPLRFRDWLTDSVSRLPSVITAGITVLFIYVLTAFSSDNSSFIYFQF
ncbi:MAG: MBOAT family protein [Sedimenticola sp.]|nr:MBOAT family protein [Sedimenticola sp.]